MAKEQQQRSFMEIMRDFFSDKNFSLFSSTFSRSATDTNQTPQSREAIIKYSDEIELIPLAELKDLILSDKESNSGSSDLGYFGMIINEAIESFELTKTFLPRDQSRDIRDMLRKALINYHNFSMELLTISEEPSLEERELLIDGFKEKVGKARDDSNLEALTYHFVKLAKDMKKST